MKKIYTSENCNDGFGNIWREETSADKLAQALYEIGENNKGRPVGKLNLKLLIGLKKPI